MDQELYNLPSVQVFRYIQIFLNLRVSSWELQAFIRQSDFKNKPQATLQTLLYRTGLYKVCRVSEVIEME